MVQWKIFKWKESGSFLYGCLSQNYFGFTVINFHFRRTPDRARAGGRRVREARLWLALPHVHSKILITAADFQVVAWLHFLTGFRVEKNIRADYLNFLRSTVNGISNK